MSSKISIILITFLMGFSLLILFSAGYQAVVQGRILSSYTPVSAIILSSSIRIHQNSLNKISYSPDIAFTYEFGGRPEYSSTPLIINKSGSWSWANEIVMSYQPRVHATAFRSPTEPNVAFLVHKPDFSPYLTVLLSLVLIGFTLLVSMRNPKIRERIGSIYLFFTVIIDVISIAIFRHYTIHGGEWAMQPLIMLLITSLGCLLMTVFAISIMFKLGKLSISLE
jgi:hypothetical protein